jgi:hypothetical protein
VVPDNEIDGDIQLARTVKVATMYDGSYSWKADAENLQYPLLGIFGKDVQTLAQAAGAGISAMYQHAFSPFKRAPSFVIEESFGDGTYGRASAGTLVQSVELDFGKVLMARMSVMPFRQVPNQYPNSSSVPTDYLFGSTAAVIPRQMQGWLGNGTNTWRSTATPTYVDIIAEPWGRPWANGPFTFASMTFGQQGTLIGGAYAPLVSSYLMVDNVAYAVEIVEGMTLTFSRAVRGDMVAGSGFDPGAITGSQFSVSGKITILFNDTTIQMAQLRHSQLSLNFQLLGLQPGTSNSQQPYSLDVFLPNMRLTQPEGPVLSDGPIMVGGTFVAKKDPTLGYAALLTLKNTFDGTQLAGAWSSSGGTSLSTTHSGATMTATTTVAATLTAVRGFQVGDTITVSSALGSDVGRQITAIVYSTGVITFTPAVTFNHAGAGATTITKTGIGTTLTGVVTASVTLPVTSTAGFHVGDQIQVTGVSGLYTIATIASATSMTVATAVTASSGATVYRAMANAGGLGGWAVS